MTDQPAAIQATFSDFRIVKGRKVAQLVLEIPLEQADAAISTLGGIPQPQSERWVALARLNGHVPEPKPDKEKQKWGDLAYALQAGIRCSEPVFWKFIRDEYKAPAHDEDESAKFVRRYCGVKSRKEINLDPNSAEAWGRLESKYQAWLKVAE
jgi:hypothetical protein